MPTVAPSESEWGTNATTGAGRCLRRHTPVVRSSEVVEQWNMHQSCSLHCCVLGMLQRGGVSAADLGLAQFRICIHDRDECFDRGEMHFSCERSYFGFGLIHGEFHKWYAPAPPWWVVATFGRQLVTCFFSKPLCDCDDHKIDQDDEEDDLCQGASIPSIRVGACVTLPPSPGGDKIPTHFPSPNLAHFTLH